MKYLLSVIISLSLLISVCAQANKGYYREFDTTNASLILSSSIGVDSGKTIACMVSYEPTSAIDSNYLQLVKLDQQGRTERIVTDKIANMKFSYINNLLKYNQNIYLFTYATKRTSLNTTIYLVLKILDTNLNIVSQQLFPVTGNPGTFKVIRDSVSNQIVVLTNDYNYFSTIWKFRMNGQLIQQSYLVQNASIFGNGFMSFDIFRNGNKYLYSSFDDAFVTDTNTTVTTIYNQFRFEQGNKSLQFYRPNIQLLNDSTAITTGVTDIGGGIDVLFVIKQPFGQSTSGRRYVELVGSVRSNFQALLKQIDIKSKSIFLGATFKGWDYDFNGTTLNAPTAIKLDSNLNEVWRYTLDSGFYYTTLGITATDDGGCLLYGTKQVSRTERRLVGWILKLRADGTITALNEPTAIESERIKVYPNPVGDDLTIEMPDYSNGELQLFDLIGRNVFQYSLNAAVQTLHLPPLVRGAYIYKIVQQGQVLKVGKMVKQ